MQAYELNVNVPDSRQITLPVYIPTGDVEIIILIKGKESKPTAGLSKNLAQGTS